MTVRAKGRVSVNMMSFLFVSTLAGCSTTSEMRETKGEGSTRTYNDSYEEVWSAANYAINAVPLSVVSSEKNDSSGTILAANPPSDMSSGENVAVFVIAKGENETSVEVVSKPTLATSFFAPDWTVPIFNNMNRQLMKVNVKRRIFLVQSTYDRLAKSIKDQLDDRYEVELYSDQSIGRVIERQVQNVSSLGNTAGSDVGSSLASAVYVNDAISSGNYNMWTDIAVGVMGGIAGAGANKAATERYRIQYSIRNPDGEIRSATVTRSSPIGAPIGQCFTLRTAELIAEVFCDGMSASEIRQKYLN